MDLTEAIVLKAAPYSETTLLLTLLTRDQGVVRAMAKGARRNRTAVQAAFEPFAWITCSLRIKSHDALGSVFNPELQESFDYLRRDVDRLAYAALGIEVLSGLALHSPPEPRFFDEAIDYLRRLEGVAAPGSLAIALLIRLLHAAGFPPRLAEPWTAATLPAALTYHFESGLFDEPRPDDPVQSMRLTREAVLPLVPALAAPPPLDGTFVLGAHTGPLVLRWLIRLWQDHLNEPLKSARFFETMIQERS